MQAEFEFTVEEVAEMYGVSQNDVHTARKIRQHGIPELIRELQKGNLTIDQALRVSGYDRKKQIRMLQRKQNSFAANPKTILPALGNLHQIVSSFAATLARFSIGLSTRNHMQQS